MWCLALFRASASAVDRNDSFYIYLSLRVAADVSHSPAAPGSRGKSGRTTHYKIKPLTLQQPPESKWTSSNGQAGVDSSPLILELPICAKFHQHWRDQHCTLEWINTGLLFFPSWPIVYNIIQSPTHKIANPHMLLLAVLMLNKHRRLVFTLQTALISLLLC